MRIDIEAYRRDGYLVLDRLLSASEAEALLEAIVASVDPEEPNELTLGTMRFASNLYRRSATIREVLVDPRVVEVVTALAAPSVWCRWDQAICKGPGSPTFPWHQDNGYTRLPHEHLQLWIALTDAPADQLKIAQLPQLPKGAELSRVDVVIRLRKE